MSRFARFLILTLMLAPTTAAAQEPPDVRRLEELRFQRMQEALSLSQEQMESLRSAMEALREESFGLRESERQSMEGLREALRKQPIDEAAIERKALAAAPMSPDTRAAMCTASTRRSDNA